MESAAAKFKNRICAFLIDALLALFFSFGINFVTQNYLFENIFLNSGWIFLIYSISCLTVANGQTIGYKLLGLKAVKADGGKLTIGSAVLRSIESSLFLAAPGNFIILLLAVSNILFSILSKQVIWDIGTKTKVINVCKNS